MASPRKLISISEAGKVYTFDAENLYEEFIRTETWKNPMTGRTLSREVVNTVVSICCPDIYVSYISQTHLVSSNATLGRIVVDFILETGASIDRDVVHLDNYTNNTTSLFQYDLKKEVLSVDISHLMLVTGNFSSDIARTGAHRQLYNFLALLPVLTAEEEILMQEVMASIRPPQTARSYEYRLPPQEIHVRAPPLVQPVEEVYEEVYESGPGFEFEEEVQEVIPQPVRTTRAVLPPAPAPRPILRTQQPIAAPILRSPQPIAAPRPVRAPLPIAQPVQRTPQRPIATTRRGVAFQEPVQAPIVERRVTTRPTRIIENVTQQDVIEQDINEVRRYNEAPEVVEEDYEGTDYYQPGVGVTRGPPAAALPVAAPIAADVPGGRIRR
ncbi:Hypothetical protein POVR1_LOCUS111 [uncultured virus]|nr:Hypothetical protein POVR1_LOCUS111 [uncultured virus]